MRIYKLFTVLIISTALILSGCSSTNYVLFNQDSKIKTIKQMRSWQASGKAAVIENNTSNSTNFNWLQHESNLTIKFTHPLGFGSAILTGQAEKFKLTLSNGRIINSDDQESLLRKELGLNLPLTSLHYWLRGLADQRLPIKSQTYDQQNLLTSLKQGDWSINYASYKAYHGVYLPCKISIFTQNIRIKIIITNWYQ
jgi:outer membrane lipoprotein LolB